LTTVLDRDRMNCVAGTLHCWRLHPGADSRTRRG